LEGLDPGSNTFTGTWWWDGFVGEFLGGTFTAEKVINGK
jgi:hypothetical protein